jgi:membrane-associated phospholipid phosphatase
MPAPVKDGRLAWQLRIAAFLLISATAMALAMRFDRTVFEHVDNSQGVETWLYFAMRKVGEISTWLIIAPLTMAVHWLWTSRRSLLQSFERGLIIIWAPLLAGILGGVLKFVVRRERPDEHAGAYEFRPWDESTWDSSGFGLPSGHASVAFGGAWILSMAYPRLAPVWFQAAMLCALSRLMTQAHFLSDVTAGALLGFASAWLVWKAFIRWCDGRAPVLLRTWRLMQERRPRGAATSHNSAAPMPSAQGPTPI